MVADDLEVATKITIDPLEVAARWVSGVENFVGSDCNISRSTSSSGTFYLRMTVQWPRSMIIENKVPFDQDVVGSEIKEDAMVTAAGDFQIPNFDEAAAAEFPSDVRSVSVDCDRAKPL